MDTDKLRILVIGSGGREHALVDALQSSPIVDQIFVAPGNGGTGTGQKTVNVNVSASDFDSLVAFAKSASINLVIPGPEQPLVDGVESAFRAAGIRVFGPSAKAAQMEGSKTFSKAFMQRHNIPTARYRNCSDVETARHYLDSVDHDVVIKASGLAAGKGVIIPNDKAEAHKALDAIMVNKEFGHAGDEVVIEEFLEGQELSILALSDGYTVLALPAAQDHKRIGDGDTGPNTGGMGTYAPTPIATPELNELVMKTVLKPSIDGMRRDGYPFVGVLFVGLMITEDGPKVLEYNVRFGDPETQSVLALLKTDLAQLILACVEHRLDAIDLRIKREESAVTVVLASGGYPGSYKKGIPITIGNLPEGVKVFHAGTIYKDGQTLTDGGRVLAVTATGPSLEQAVQLAYLGVEQVSFEGKTFRKDIAHRALVVPSPATSPRPKLPPPVSSHRFTYAAAGVSIDAGNALVQAIKPAVKATLRPGTDSEIGGFGGLFDLKAAGYTDPILVSGTDGVGTKLIVAQQTRSHETVGIDLVAMSVNDLLVQGAEPLYFLDYFACSKLDTATAAEVIRGIAAGCKTAGCALIGGETAEMPDLYRDDDYDLGGFAVGAVERADLLPSASDPVRSGDVLLGLASSGLHSNGFSLVRKVVKARGVAYNSPCPWVPRSGAHVTTVGESLLTPTRIYIQQILPVLRQFRGAGGVRAMSHITGGGFIDNIPRVLPAGLGVEVDAASWAMPSVFKWLMGDGNIETTEMARTFNCGIGMVLVVAQEDAEKVQRALDAYTGPDKAEVYKIGKVVDGEGVNMLNLKHWEKVSVRRSSGTF